MLISILSTLHKPESSEKKIISIEKTHPSDWPVGKPERHFLE